MTKAEQMKDCPLSDLVAVAGEIYQRWDTDQRSGKLLSALAGTLQGYDPRVDRIRAALTTRIEPCEARAALLLARGALRGGADKRLKCDARRAVAAALAPSPTAPANAVEVTQADRDAATALGGKEAALSALRQVARQMFAVVSGENDQWAETITAVERDLAIILATPSPTRRWACEHGEYSSLCDCPICGPQVEPESLTPSPAYTQGTTDAELLAAQEALRPFAQIPLCYPRRGSQPQHAELDTPAPGAAYTAADVVRARKLFP